MAAGIDSSESVPGLLESLNIQALAGRYNNPIPTRFLAPKDCLKFPAKRLHFCRLVKWGKSVPGLSRNQIWNLKWWALKR
jgi:hypothetical protein